MSGVIVEVTGRTFAIPFECPCCGAAPDGELTVPPPRDSRADDDPPRGVDFPYCRACVAHATAWSRASSAASAVMLVGIAAGATVAAFTRVIVGFAVVGSAAAIALAVRRSRRAQARTSCGPACAAPGIAVAYLGAPSGVRMFSFASPTYTARFAEQNAAQLNNASPQLRKLVEGHRVARLVVPTPAAAVTIVAPPPTIADWLTRLDAAPGRVARRNMLSRALDLLHEPGDRERLITAAVRLELAPVLDRIDDRSSAAARRQQLEAAISDVRADNLSDDLRDAMLRELDARLRALR
jgi:hypothetical protein